MSLIAKAQQTFFDVHLHPELMEYILTLCETTRSHELVLLGASPRAAIALMRAVQAYAAVSGREYCIPEDVKRLAEPVLAHRLIMKPSARINDNAAHDAIMQVLSKVPAPTERFY